MPENITSGLIGEPGEGTTIDLDEPFLLRWPDLYNPVPVSSLFPTYIPRIGCDADGWMVLPNKEPSYAHFFHVFSHTEIRNILVTGDAEIGYIGFGEKGERNLQWTLLCSLVTKSNPNMHIKTAALVFERKPRKISGHPDPCLGQLNIVRWEWTVYHIWYF